MRNEFIGFQLGHSLLSGSIQLWLKLNTHFCECSQRSICQKWHPETEMFSQKPFKKTNENAGPTYRTSLSKEPGSRMRTTKHATYSPTHHASSNKQSTNTITDRKHFTKPHEEMKDNALHLVGTITLEFWSSLYASYV